MIKDKSYMELCFHVNGGENLYLRIPTVWDDIKKQWIGFVKLHKSQKLIYGEGKTNFELQNSFNKAVSDVFSQGGENAEELFAMFMPAWYWQDKQI